MANIGYSGADAYVDMRDCIASWIDESTAVYQEGDYEITFTCTDGTLYLTENMPEPYGSLSIAGEYVPIEEAVYPDCEYVFPFSSEYEVMEVDCDGLTAEECGSQKMRSMRGMDACLMIRFCRTILTAAAGIRRVSRRRIHGGYAE